MRACARARACVCVCACACARVCVRGIVKHVLFLMIHTGFKGAYTRVDWRALGRPACWSLCCHLCPQLRGHHFWWHCAAWADRVRWNVILFCRLIDLYILRSLYIYIYIYTYIQPTLMTNAAWCCLKSKQSKFYLDSAIYWDLKKHANSTYLWMHACISSFEKKVGEDCSCSGKVGRQRCKPLARHRSCRSGVAAQPSWCT